MEDSVRRATVADADTLGQLLHDFNVEFETATPTAVEFADRFRLLLAGSDLVAFLFEDATEETIGFALLSLRSTPYFDGPLVQLEELYVKPEHRDRGIGTTLIETIIEFARAQESQEVHINVDEIDVDTRRFYERHRFVNIQPGKEYRMLVYLQELQIRS